MLITNLLPMLGNYSLAFDLVAGDDGVVTLIIIPRVAEGKTHKAEAGELRPISITATAAEIDAELAGIVRNVWQHFIGARLKPYVEAGCHLAPEAPCSAFAG